MLEASSPAKAILFGEHAVIYGKPAIAIALDLRMSIRVRESSSTSVDGGYITMNRHRYVRWALENIWKGGPLEIKTRSDIPSASGLGSSAALCCSIVAAIQIMGGSFQRAECARQAFEVEYNVQGKASPTDTSCSAHGRPILVSFKEEENHLWSVSKGDRCWHVHHIDSEPLTLVVGFTGRPSVTHLQVEKVAGFYRRSGFAVETIDEMGDIVIDGLKALKAGDRVGLGELMNRNHSLLTIVGVNTPELQKLKEAADPTSYGSKITGAGGGGSIIALTDRPEKTAANIERRGGRPFIARFSERGTEARWLGGDP